MNNAQVRLQDRNVIFDPKRLAGTQGFLQPGERLFHMTESEQNQALDPQGLREGILHISQRRTFGQFQDLFNVLLRTVIIPKLTANLSPADKRRRPFDLVPALPKFRLGQIEKFQGLTVVAAGSMDGSKQGNKRRVGRYDITRQFIQPIRQG